MHRESGFIRCACGLIRERAQPSFKVPKSKRMKLLPIIVPVLILTASCSEPDGEATKGEKPLCTAEAAGAVTAEKATELLNAVKRSEGAARRAACARFKAVIDDGGNAGIADAPSCRWDNRNSNGNPRFLISLHLTQLKGQARQSCGDLD